MLAFNACDMLLTTGVIRIPSYTRPTRRAISRRTETRIICRRVFSCTSSPQSLSRKPLQRITPEVDASA